MAPNSMHKPISPAAAPPPSRLTATNTTPLTSQMAASIADWLRSSLRTKARSRGTGGRPAVNHRSLPSTTTTA